MKLSGWQFQNWYTWKAEVVRLVILAGGRGTRMGELTSACPKPMVPIAGKPILAHQLELAARYDVRDVILLIEHMGDAIQSYFGSEWNGMRLQYLREDQPLGTAGAVGSARHLLNEDFLVFYGDTVMDLDLRRLQAAHCSARSGLGTLVVHPNDHPYDSDIVEVQGTRVTAIRSKPHPPEFESRNLVSAALYILRPAIFAHIEHGVYADFGRDIFPRLVRENQPINAYITSEYIKDVGTPERHQEVERDLLSGKVARLNRGNLRPCVFLDRDGTLNREVDCVRVADDLELIGGVSSAIRKLNRSDYLAVVVTNQPGVAKGFIDEAELERIHARLDTELGRSQAYLDRIYVCPHHPEKGFPGERTELKQICNCRKPAIGLFLQAASELGIDLAQSFVIGDRTVDVLAGLHAGVTPILVRTGFGGKDRKYDCEPAAICADLSSAVDLILNQNVSNRSN